MRAVTPVRAVTAMRAVAPMAPVAAVAPVTAVGAVAPVAAVRGVGQMLREQDVLAVGFAPANYNLIPAVSKKISCCQSMSLFEIGGQHNPL